MFHRGRQPWAAACVMSRSPQLAGYRLNPGFAASDAVLSSYLGVQSATVRVSRTGSETRGRSAADEEEEVK